MAGALGTGLRPGEVAISVGTSGTVFAQSEQPVQDPTGAIAGFADATGRYLPLVCTLNATLVTEAISRLLSVDHSGLDDLALAAPSGCDGLVLVPYLVGERTPNRPHATGTLEGIRSDVSRELLARAAFEGVVCSLLDGLDALEAAGVPIRTGRMVLLGGGARSSAYRQILATLADRTVTVPYDNEIVSAGAAVQAAVLATGSDPTAVAEAWNLREGETTAPGASSATSEEVRRRFAEARG
jgi:xylulokinase